MIFLKRALVFTAFFAGCILLLHSRQSTSPTLHRVSSRLLFRTSPRYLSSSLAARSRLGNHLFEFASLYGISHQLNRTPVFWIEDEAYRKMWKQTNDVVPGLVGKFQVFEGKVHVNYTTFHEQSRVYDNPQRLESAEDEYLHLTGHFYQSWKYFAGLRDEILSYLKPRKEFEGLPKSDESTLITCIHTRRTDFLSYGFYASEANFIRKAVDFIEDRERQKKNLKLKTVIFGDDPKFMKSIWPASSGSNNTKVNDSSTVHFVSANSPSDDLLYSSQHCDNVLISAPGSTFGWWIGYLSKGDRVFYLDVTTVNDSVYKSGRMNLDDYFLPKWTALRMSPDNKTVV